MNRPLLSTRIQQMLWGADERLIAPTTDGKQTQFEVRRVSPIRETTGTPK
jgi:hypothetical protein